MGDGGIYNHHGGRMARQHRNRVRRCSRADIEAAAFLALSKADFDAAFANHDFRPSRFLLICLTSGNGRYAAEKTTTLT